MNRITRHLEAVFGKARPVKAKTRDKQIEIPLDPWVDASERSSRRVVKLSLPADLTAGELEGCLQKAGFAAMTFPNGFWKQSYSWQMGYITGAWEVLNPDKPKLEGCPIIPGTVEWTDWQAGYKAAREERE